MADWGKLKQLAEAAAEIDSWYEERDFHAGGFSEMELDIVRSSDRDFIIATNPAAILALIAENERLQAELDLGQAHGRALQRIGSALGLAAGSDLHTDCVPKIYSLFASIGRTIADSAQARMRFSAERDQLRAEVEALRGSCKALGRENTLLTRRAKKAERAVLWFASIRVGFLRPKWLVAVIDSLKGGRADG